MVWSTLQKFIGLGTDMLFALGMIVGILVIIIIWLFIREDEQ
jgi:hypothetical protein